MNTRHRALAVLHRALAVLHRALAVLLLSIPWMLPGCTTGKDFKELFIPVEEGFTVAKGTQIAAQTMKDLGYTIRENYPQDGYVFGETSRVIVLKYEAYFLEIQIGVDETTLQLQVVARVIPGPQMAMGIQLEDFLDNFLESFKEAMATREKAPNP